jgi:hypothetical protein
MIAKMISAISGPYNAIGLSRAWGEVIFNPD